jgi:PD-(D/E)XK nuclease superfamily
MTTRFIRQSEIRAFKNCPRSWLMSYKLNGAGYEFVPTDAPQSGQRDIGTIVHEALHALYLGKDPTGCINVRKARHVLEQGNEPLSKEWLATYKLATIMVEGYVEWLGKSGADAGEQTLHLEKAIQIPLGEILGDEVILTCQIDRIVFDTLSHEYIVEDNKTVQSLDQATETLQVDDQGLIYAIAVQAGLGIKVNRFRHNMLRKVQRSAKATPPFYGRYEVRYNDTQLDNAWTHTIVTIQRMVEALQRIEADINAHHLYAVPNPGKDCTWRCDFLHVCPMMDEGADWQGYVRDSGIYVPRQIPVRAE